jgi:predicted DNA-binding transcriptional regulator AlpA
MNSETPNDLMAVAEAQRLLGVSHAKIAQLIKEGTLRHFPNPLDRRVKLVSRSEVLALKPSRVDEAA